MNEILRFNYKGTELYVFEENNKFIYLKQQANNISQDLTNEEKEVTSKVLLQIMPSRNLSDLGYIKYNQKKFRHFYDIKTGFHVFYEGDNFKTPNDKDLFNLNMVFNYENDYVAVYRHMNEEDRKKNNIKRIIKIGSLTLVVFVSLYGIKVGLNKLVKDEPIVLNDGQTVVAPKIDYEYVPSNNKIEKVQVTSEEIMKSIASNTNISDLEKRLFLASSSFFQDIAPYFDSNLLYDLNHFKIEYHNEPGKNGENGTWESVLLNMNIFNTKGFETSSTEILTHEFIHVFSNISNLSLGNSLYEAITVNLNNEYFGGTNKYDQSYNWLNRYSRPLMELIERDNLLSYYANPNPSILTNALMQIIPDFNMACRVLNNLDTYNRIWRNHYNASFQEQFGDMMNQVITELSIDLETYYDAKYTNNNEVNLGLLYRINKERACLEIGNLENLDDITMKNILMYPDAVILQEDGNLFNKNNNKKMVIHFPTKFYTEERYYTKEQLLLTGVDGLKYDRLCDIDLPLMPDGTYKYVIDDKEYSDYIVPDIYLKNEIKNSK